MPVCTPHCTVVLGCYPGADGLRDGLASVLRLRSDTFGNDTVSLQADLETGDVVEVAGSLMPKLPPDAAPDRDDADDAIRGGARRPLRASPALPLRNDWGARWARIRTQGQRAAAAFSTSTPPPMTLS